MASGRGLLPELVRGTLILLGETGRGWTDNDASEAVPAAERFPKGGLTSGLALRRRTPRRRQARTLPARHVFRLLPVRYYMTRPSLYRSQAGGSDSFLHSPRRSQLLPGCRSFSPTLRGIAQSCPCAQPRACAAVIQTRKSRNRTEAGAGRPSADVDEGAGVAGVVEVVVVCGRPRYVRVGGPRGGCEMIIFAYVPRALPQRPIRPAT